MFWKNKGVCRTLTDSSPGHKKMTSVSNTRSCWSHDYSEAVCWEEERGGGITVYKSEQRHWNVLTAWWRVKSYVKLYEHSVTVHLFLQLNLEEFPHGFYSNAQEKKQKQTINRIWPDYLLFFFKPSARWHWGWRSPSHSNLKKNKNTLPNNQQLIKHSQQEGVWGRQLFFFFF